MNRLTLLRLACDFAYGTLDVKDEFQLAQASLDTFKANKGSSADLQLWSQYCAQARQQYLMVNKQPLPSAVILPAMPASVQLKQEALASGEVTPPFKA